MPYFLSPIGNSQIVDANGDPLVGGTIETYLAGTSTAATTYTDDTGGTPQGAVITLNSLGRPTLGPVWMAGGVPLKFIIKNALGVVQPPTYDDISGIGDTSVTPDQFPFIAPTPTYISATSFSFAGDQTNDAQVNRRIRSINTGGTIYSTISNAVFGAGITTVTVVNDSGVLDSGLSQVNYSLLTATNNSLPLATTAQVRTGTSLLPPSVASMRNGLIVLGTEVATTSGTFFDFVVPAWAKNVTVLFDGVSTNGAAPYLIQLGDSGGIENTNYKCSGTDVVGASGINSTAGFVIGTAQAAGTVSSGYIDLKMMNESTFKWIAFGGLSPSSTGQQYFTSGSKSLSAALTTVRITTTTGATFDLGSVNVSYS